MEMRHNQQPPDGVAQQRASNELIRLIRKLRWIGMGGGRSGKGAGGIDDVPRSTDEQCYRGVARRTSAFETISCSRKYPCPADVVLRAGRWSTETARVIF